jgi:hypothetical protein
MRGGGNANEGKCTIEVVVDGAADVEIRGDQASIRNLSGQPGQMRRFECTGALPNNPADFRFAGVDGRGRQQLIRDPRNGGTAVVRIEDPDGGREGYTFDIMWGGNYGGGQIYNPGGGGGGRIPGNRFETNEAVAVCQDEVRVQAAQRFNARNIAFLRTVLDDNPGRRDWVIGNFVARRAFGRTQNYRFSCAVNFNNGNVRNVDIQPLTGPSGFESAFGNPPGSERAIQSCQRSVQQRLRSQGFPNVDFSSIGLDNNPGRRDWIVGNARAGVGARRDWFDFSCSVNLQNGNVRSVEVNRR